MKSKFPLVFFFLFLLTSSYLFLRIYERYEPLPAVLQTEEKIAPDQNLHIPSVGISLPVFTKEVKSANWPVSSNGVIKVADKNIYYGHNWPRLLAKLHDVKIGDPITINFDTYKVSKIVIVNPTNTEILNQASESMLIIYTCTGFLDRDRLVVIAQSGN